MRSNGAFGQASQCPLRRSFADPGLVSDLGPRTPLMAQGRDRRAIHCDFGTANQSAFRLCRCHATTDGKETPVESGNGFVRRCASTEKDSSAMTDVERGYAAACLFYLNGFVTGVNYGTGFAEEKTKQRVPSPFCIPKGVETGQLTKIVLKYIRNNPETAHLPTPRLITNALGEAYPVPINKPD
jgi:hypothetical protein